MLLFIKEHNMTNGQVAQLPAEQSFFPDGQATIETGQEIIQHFENGRVLTFRPFRGSALRGFTADLVDFSHRLKPRCLLMNNIDDENRLSVEIKLAFGNIPQKTMWGKITSSIKMRSYAVDIPEWRLGDAWYKEGREIASRDKISMRSNTETLVSERDRIGNSFKMQKSLKSISEIPDELWQPCFDFSVVAANIIRSGEFPDFSALNDLEPLTGKTYHATDRVLSYRGALKPAEM